MSGDFASEWSTATVGDGEQQQVNFDPPADGDHVAELRRGSAFTSRKDEDWVVLDFRELKTGHDWRVMLGFRSQPQANVTKTACSRLGIQVDEVVSLAQLNTELERCEGNYYEVAVQTNGDFRNTYVNGPARRPVSQQLPTTDVPVDESDFEPVTSPAADDDRIPF